VVPVLLFGLSASSRLEVRCALTGLVMPDCCPEAEPALARPEQHASISERDCCNRTVVATDKLPVASPEPGLKRAPPVISRLVPSVLAEAVPAFDVRTAGTNPGPARSSPPPYVRSHAFLI
jgi:hypothetical protein